MPVGELPGSAESVPCGIWRRTVTGDGSDNPSEGEPSDNLSKAWRRTKATRMEPSSA